jgi:hypothetical protein
MIFVSDWRPIPTLTLPLKGREFHDYSFPLRGASALLVGEVGKWVV